jgi:hypothetical protein
MKLEFSWQILKKILKYHVMKNCPMEAELFHADGRTDRQTDVMKLPFTVRNSANVLEKCINKKQYSYKK